MESDISQTAFGPVPSRRLGRSLGINNIPPKRCSYGCIYCQVGKTSNIQVERREFYRPEKVFRDVEEKAIKARRAGESINYLAFVPDGEPTLDIHLGEEITLLKKLGLKIAVITNSSLIWKKDVRDELCEADWVSLKIDALSPDVWRKVNRPHGSLSLDQILEGVSEFAGTFKGDLTTETMLVQGVNDHGEEIEKISDFAAGIKPMKSYLAVPIRPPLEKWVSPPDEDSLNTAYQVFEGKSIHPEYLTGYEGNSFAFTGNVEDDLLSITSVHPMRKEAVCEFLEKAEADWEAIDKLIRERKLVEVSHEGKIFYLRKMPRKK